MPQPHPVEPLVPRRHPIDTTLFDFFKIGPGPSSSHTIGPMKAGSDFVERCAAPPAAALSRAAALRVTLLGSLSATGKGHGIDTAVLAGLLGSQPETCSPEVLPALCKDPQARHSLRLGDRRIAISLEDIRFGPVQHDAPFSNTLICSLLDAAGAEIFSMEYYSVGGGFIQWKGWTPPERGRPAHPYGTMRELHRCLNESGLTLHELILENETAITGMSRRPSSSGWTA